MTFSTFQGIGGRAMLFLSLQYSVSFQVCACAFICLQCTLVSLCVTIRHVVSLGLVGGAGLVMFTYTARCRVIFLDICKQNKPRTDLEKWNQPGKVQPEATVLHNTGATEPMAADLHHSSAGIAAIPSWLRNHHFASLNSLQVIVPFFGGTENYALQPLPESLLCSEKTVSHLALPCPKCLTPLASSLSCLSPGFVIPFLSTRTSHDLDPFLLLK